MKLWESDEVLCIDDFDKRAEANYEAYKELVGKRAIPKTEYTFNAVEAMEHIVELYGNNCNTHWKVYKLFGQYHFDISINGPRKEPVNPYEDESYYSRYYMRNYARAPRYHYDERRQLNHLVYDAPLLPKKMTMMKKILLAILLALVVYFLLGLFPENVKTTILDNVSTPIFSKITAIISGVATPLVFISVISGIIGVGSSATVSKIGGQFIKCMMLAYAFAAVAFSAIAVLFYGVSSISSSGDSSAIGELITLVLDMMPSNLFACFVNDNALQVIVLAIFVGIVLLILADKAKPIADAIEVLGDLINKMMTILCKLLPLIVFLGVLNILCMDIGHISGVYKVVVAFVICAIAIEAFVMIRLRVVTGASPFKLFKVQIPTTMMNLTTSSQVGTMPENVRCLREDVGIDEKLINFCTPLGVVTYMPNGAAFIGFVAWCMAELTATPVDFLGLVKIAIVSVVIAIAAPPIPGSAFAVMPIIFSACGIPLDYYSVAIVLGTILGYFLPVLNGYALQLETIITAYKLDMIDKEKFARFAASSKKKE